MAHDVISDGFDLKNFEKLPAREVPVSALSPGLYLRQGGTNAAHVQLLIDAAGSSTLPPILVQEDGRRVIDGLHRLEVAKLCGDHIIQARFLDCTDSEALVLAMKANSAHGLPLSKADRVSGAKRVLTEHPDWSDRAIAGITGLSAKTIASLRSRSGNAAQLAGKRLGRDGIRRPVAAGEGRLRAAEYISAHPNAPLRQVARETDVSLGTVHDVSARLRRGVSPEQNGHRVTAVRLAVHPANGVVHPANGVVHLADGVVHSTNGTVHPVNGTAPPNGVGHPVNGTAPPNGVGHPVNGTAHPVNGDAVTVAPSASGPPLRRKNYADAPLTWARVAANVANDPTIRYTDSGKEFYRWMASHGTHTDGWRDFVNAIPAHWLSVMAPIADSISKEWGLFAERLRCRQDGVR